MKNFLQEIVNWKRREVESLKNRTPITHFVDSKRLLKGVRPFKDAISGGGRVNLIAEIKKKAPSRRRNFFKKLDVAVLAGIYENNGARALSILTDKKFFGGNILHISEARRAVSLPVLRKDFIIDEYQVYESRYFGADAILLIAGILTVEQIKSFTHLAKRIGMESLVEVHDENDLGKALSAEARIIGINNRDLNTFEVNVENTIRLVSQIPKEVIKVSESGIKSNEDIVKLMKNGVNAVLIGTSFLESSDIGSKVNEIMGGSKLS
jgi:indole-3-glycerol phosphate synthase